jgi:hypothetical protein
VLSLKASGAGSPEAALLAMGDAELAALAHQALQAEGHFALPPAAAVPPASAPSPTPGEGAVRVEVLLAGAWPLGPQQGPGAPGVPGAQAVEVGLTLVLRHAAADGRQWRDEVDARAVEPVRGEPGDAARRALLAALRDVGRRAHPFLQAHLAPTDALLAALPGATAAVPADGQTALEAAREGAVREAALHALVERRHPGALPPLLAALEKPGAGPLEVRRAVGALVRLGDVRAVPALIARVPRGDPGFLTELVWALGALGGAEAEAYLFTVAQGHDSAPVREAARQALTEAQARRRGGGSGQGGAVGSEGVRQR